MCQQNLLCNHASSSPPNGGGNGGGCGNDHCKVTAVTMTTTTTADADADADARSSSSSCHSSSGATARGGEYRRPRTSAAPALAALAGSKGPATAAMRIAAASSPPQVSAAGTPTGRCFPPSSPSSPRGIDSSGGAARRGVLPPGAARG
jgi:hypothetical protein